MDIDAALRQFRGEKSYGTADMAVIMEAVGALGVTDFLLHEDYVYDVSDIVHIHPTMIVASRPFPGSVDRGSLPYPDCPHFRPLSRWRGR